MLRQALAENGLAAPGHTTLLLLGHVLKKTKSWLLAHGEFELSKKDIQTLQNGLERLLQGFPLPYLLGSWAFYGRSFEISPEVLIPRPETELLVETALDMIKNKTAPTIIDVGTGSGIIAISLACERKDAQIIAVDISRPALRVAASNANRLSSKPIQFIQTDLLRPIKAKFDLICANLPYIPRATLQNLPVSQWEPQLALDGGQTGLDVIQRLLSQCPACLNPGGVILLEIEATLGKASLQASRDRLPHMKASLRQDLAGRDRLLILKN